MVKLYWKVAEPSTGRYRSFDHRSWPSAYYGKPGESPPAAALYCEDEYVPSRVRTGEHKEITICVYWHGHEKNPQSWTVFTLKRRAATLDEAKQIVQAWINERPNWRPQEYRK